MKISVIIPFKNEREYARVTMEKVESFLKKEKRDFEIIAVDDSNDGTWEIIKGFEKRHKRVKAIKGDKPAGYGKALRKGFSLATGDILIPFNGDMCDSLEDLMKYVRVIEGGYDMAFGSRYMEGGRFIDYPSHKIMFSRLGNLFLMAVFRVRCTDITNTFKAFRSEVVEAVRPRAESYELGLELALKGVRKGFTYKTIPISWTGRKYGRSKMRLAVSIIKHFRMSAKILLGG